MTTSEWFRSVWGKMTFWSLFFTCARFGYDLWVGAETDAARMLVVLYIIFIGGIFGVVKAVLERGK